MPMKMDPKFISLGLLLVLLGFTAGYLLQLSNGPGREPDLVLAHDPDCDLNLSACKTRLPDQGLVEFSIEPRPVYGASPLRFELRTERLTIKNAVLKLSGLDMNMGSYQFGLESNAEGGWSIEGNLPVCVRNRMQWKGELRLDTGEHGLVQLGYIFAAYKQGATD